MRQRDFLLFSVGACFRFSLSLCRSPHKRSFSQVYLEDALTFRLWVDNPQAALLVSNILTVLSPHTEAQSHTTSSTSSSSSSPSSLSPSLSESSGGELILGGGVVRQEAPGRARTPQGGRARAGTPSSGAPVSVHGHEQVLLSSSSSSFSSGDIKHEQQHDVMIEQYSDQSQNKRASPAPLIMIPSSSSSSSFSSVSSSPSPVTEPRIALPRLPSPSPSLRPGRESPHSDSTGGETDSGSANVSWGE